MPASTSADGFPLVLSVSGNDFDWRGTLFVATNSDSRLLRLELHGRHYDPGTDTVNAGGPFLDLSIEGRPAIDGSFVTSGFLPVDFELSHARTTPSGVEHDTLIVTEIRDAALVLTADGASGYVTVGGLYQGAPEVDGEARIDIMGPVECRATVDVPIELADGTTGTMRCPAIVGQPLFVAQ